MPRWTLATFITNVLDLLWNASPRRPLTGASFLDGSPVLSAWDFGASALCSVTPKVNFCWHSIYIIFRTTLSVDISTAWVGIHSR